MFFLSASFRLVSLLVLLELVLLHTFAACLAPSSLASCCLPLWITCCDDLACLCRPYGLSCMCLTCLASRRDLVRRYAYLTCVAQTWLRALQDSE